MAEALNNQQCQLLKGLAHHLEPIVRVGSKGLSPSVCTSIGQALEDHELIKVKFGSAYIGDHRDAAIDLATTTQAHLCQVIGRIAVLYKRRKQDGKPRIDLSDTKGMK